MHHHQITSLSSTILLPATRRRFSHLKDYVEDPSSASLDALLELACREADILGVGNLSRVVVLLC